MKPQKKFDFVIPDLIRYPEGSEADNISLQSVFIRVRIGKSRNDTEFIKSLQFRYSFVRERGYL